MTIFTYAQAIINIDIAQDVENNFERGQVAQLLKYKDINKQSQQGCLPNTVQGEEKKPFVSGNHHGNTCGPSIDRIENVKLGSQSNIQSMKILILKGEGPVFSAGHDLIELKNTSQPQIIFTECMNTLLKLKTFPLITLCAVDNMATAAGFQLALTCDIIIATKGASFGIPGMKRGLFPSTPLVQLQRSLQAACLVKQIVIMGDMLTAEDAYRYGLINKVVQNDQLDVFVNSYIQKTNKLSGEVINFGKKVINGQALTPKEETCCIGQIKQHSSDTKLQEGTTDL